MFKILVNIVSSFFCFEFYQFYYIYFSITCLFKLFLMLAIWSFFLQFNEYDILKDAGKIRKSVADSFAEKQYEEFRVIQDREYKSDFDKVVENIKVKGELPEESEDRS